MLFPAGRSEPLITVPRPRTRCIFIGLRYLTGELGELRREDESARRTWRRSARLHPPPVVVIVALKTTDVDGDMYGVYGGVCLSHTAGLTLAPIRRRRSEASSIHPPHQLPHPTDHFLGTSAWINGTFAHQGVKFQKMYCGHGGAAPSTRESGVTQPQPQLRAEGPHLDPSILQV